MQTIKNTTIKIFLFFLICNLFLLTSIEILNFYYNILWCCLHFRLSHIFSSFFFFFYLIMIVFFIYCLCYLILCWWHELWLLFRLYVGRVWFVVVWGLFWWCLFLGTHLLYISISRYIFIIFFDSLDFIVYLFRAFICSSLCYHRNTILFFLFMCIRLFLFCFKNFFM